MQNLKNINIILLFFIITLSALNCKVKKNKKSSKNLEIDSTINKISSPVNYKRQPSEYEKKINEEWENRTRIGYYFFYKYNYFLSEEKLDSLVRISYQIDTAEFNKLQENYYKNK